jgi:sec-independent protein translocase protein TatA
MPFGIQPLHLILILVVALLFFGPNKLPEIGRGVGKAITEFKKGTREMTDSFNSELDRPEVHTVTAPILTAYSPEIKPQTILPTNYCIQCGAPNPSGARFCNRCGSQIPAKVSAQKTIIKEIDHPVEKIISTEIKEISQPKVETVTTDLKDLVQPVVEETTTPELN